MTRVLVVGAGVVGLSCAVRLAESGHRVDVVARDLPLETTSVVAAALWYPYKVGPAARASAWAAAGYRVFAELAAEPGSGVRMMRGTELVGAGAPVPEWAATVDDLEEIEGGPHTRRRFSAPVVDMPAYLTWLTGRLQSLGGTLTRMSLGGLPPARGGGVVVNCSGIGARLLAGDATLTPGRGQIVIVRGLELDTWWLDGAGPTYVVPRQDSVVVGGTDVDGDWSRSPSPATVTAIMQRATRLVPELARAEVVTTRVGLRPVRPAVRLEREGGVVHCYGHGGAGVTLSWGCAEEVVALVAG